MPSVKQSPALLFGFGAGLLALGGCESGDLARFVQFDRLVLERPDLHHLPEYRHAKFIGQWFRHGWGSFLFHKACRLSEAAERAHVADVDAYVHRLAFVPGGLHANGMRAAGDDHLGLARESLRELIDDNNQPSRKAPLVYRMSSCGRSTNIRIDYALLLFRKGQSSQS